MVRPNFIPRTLIGVGGVRLFNIPGVIYPEEMLRAKPSVKNREGKAYSTPPEWGITSRTAAEMLGCSISAARYTMHRHKVNYRLVVGEGTRRIYWRKTQVEKLAASRAPKVSKVPRKLIDAKEATRILGVSRSTLQRYYQAGKLKTIPVRFVLPVGGARNRTYLLRAEVMTLAARLNAKRRRAEELDELLNGDAHPKGKSRVQAPSMPSRQRA